MKIRISDHEAEQLLAGRAPEGPPEFGELAATLEAFRSAAFGTVPRPSDELAARFGVSSGMPESSMATSSDGLSRRLEADSFAVAPTPRGRAIGRVMERVSGLGLAARVAVGAGAVLVGITVAGAAGALPGGMQDVFNDIVSTVIPVEGGIEVVIDDEEPTVDDEPSGDEAAPGGQAPPDDGDEVDSPDDAEVDDVSESGDDAEPEDAAEGSGDGGPGSEPEELESEEPEFDDPESSSEHSGSGSGQIP